MTITIDYVVEFDCEGKTDLSESLMALDGKQFKFTQEYTLKANINSISSFTAEGEIIAGQRHEEVVNSEEWVVANKFNKIFSFTAYLSRFNFK